MNIYRYRQTQRCFLVDAELVELIRYINTYVGRTARCCDPAIEYEISDQSNLRLISKGKALTYGGQMYTRIPFYTNLEVYFRYSEPHDTFRFVISDNDAYILYRLKFGSKPSFISATKFIARI